MGKRQKGEVFSVAIALQTKKKKKRSRDESLGETLRQAVALAVRGLWVDVRVCACACLPPDLSDLYPKHEISPW